MLGNGLFVEVAGAQGAIRPTQDEGPESPVELFRAEFFGSHLRSIGRTRK